MNNWSLREKECAESKPELFKSLLLKVWIVKQHSTWECVRNCRILAKFPTPEQPRDLLLNKISRLFCTLESIKWQRANLVYATGSLESYKAGNSEILRKTKCYMALAKLSTLRWVFSRIHMARNQWFGRRIWPRSYSNNNIYLLHFIQTYLVKSVFSVIYF